jgi:putative tryptophan/tyrosine transport system substrate-binding protein
VIRERPQALVLLSHPVISRNRKQIADVALKYRLPTITVFTNFPEVGGLIGYGPNFPDFWRRGASYVDRILKGAKSGDLPIERPTS